MEKGKDRSPQPSVDDYRKAKERIAQLKTAVSESNAFRLDSSVRAATEYFEALRKSSPQIYEILKIQRKEIAELAIKKRTGRSVMLD